MPPRLFCSAWATRFVLLAALLPLVQCGPARDQFAPACPDRAFLGEAADIDIYRPGGHDLTDLILHGRAVGLQGSCRSGEEKSQLAVTVSPAFELTRGPAMQGRQVDVPVFIAVTLGGTVLDKRVFAMRAAFPANIDRVTLTPGDTTLVLPVSGSRSGSAYTILTGFQLTPEQRAHNRQVRGP